MSVLSEIQVIYLYKLVLAGGVELSKAIELVEYDLQETVLDETCRDGATGSQRSLARAHAISKYPKDIPSGTCIACYSVLRYRLFLSLFSHSLPTHTNFALCFSPLQRPVEQTVTL